MSKNNNTQKIVGLGLFTAIVIVLQLMGSFIRFGTFSISLVLVPVVIGAALYGAGAGAWLGFVFGVVVLLSGDVPRCQRARHDPDGARQGRAGGPSLRPCLQGA